MQTDILTTDQALLDSSLPKFSSEYAAISNPYSGRYGVTVSRKTSPAPSSNKTLPSDRATGTMVSTGRSPVSPNVFPLNYSTSSRIARWTITLLLRQIPCRASMAKLERNWLTSRHRIACVSSAASFCSLSPLVWISRYATVGTIGGMQILTHAARKTSGQNRIK